MTQTDLPATSSPTGKWNPYPAYKDSGVEWLGEIPEYWKVLPLRRVVCTFVDYRGATPIKVPNGIPLITARNIKNGVIDFTLSQEFISEEEYAGRMVRGFPKIGDVLVTTEAPLGESAQITDEKIALAQRIILLKLNKYEMNNNYVKYHFASESGKGELWSRATGSTAIGIKASHLKETLITVPPLSKQQAIAAFLDHETAKINTLIAKKERMIELLQEKRTTLISHAVTKGLDPAVPMKDSGVEWIGEIPEHWEVKRLKFCLHSIEQGWSPACENRPAAIDEWGVLKVGCVNGTKFNPNENKALLAEMKPLPELEIKPGDVLVSRANTRELLGSASVVTKVRSHLLLCDKLYRLKILPKTVDPIYLVLAMRSSIIRFQLEREATGASSSMQNISQRTILNLVVPLPDISEQEAIVTYLNRETAKIDALIAKIRDGIGKLKEYSAALISAAVTGKIDVREEVTTQDDVAL